MYSLNDLFIPDSWLYLVVFLFGVIIGSFLNVYIYRFHTGKSLAGHSHCLSCGTRLTWYELFPLLSYLGLRGRCRTCNCRITPRYFLVELMTGLLFALSLTLTKELWWLLLLCLTMSVLVVITVYDFYHFIIPDALTFALTVLAGLILTYKYTLVVFNLEQIFWSVVTALGASGFFLLLWLVSKGQWLGFGDVKLAFPLGLLVGPAAVFSFVVVSFWVGAAISLSILGWGRMKREKPAYIYLLETLQ